MCRGCLWWVVAREWAATYLKRALESFGWVDHGPSVSRPSEVPMTGPVSSTKQRYYLFYHHKSIVCHSHFQIRWWEWHMSSTCNGQVEEAVSMYFTQWDSVYATSFDVWEALSFLNYCHCQRKNSNMLTSSGFYCSSGPARITLKSVRVVYPYDHSWPHHIVYNYVCCYWLHVKLSSNQWFCSDSDNGTRWLRSAPWRIEWCGIWGR